MAAVTMAGQIFEILLWNLIRPVAAGLLSLLMATTRTGHSHIMFKKKNDERLTFSLFFAGMI
jgi:hypothetical protein